MIHPNPHSANQATLRLAQFAHHASAADNDDDDLDDLLSETGDVTNRSSGKTGTNTTAEPDKDKPAAPSTSDNSGDNRQ